MISNVEFRTAMKYFGAEVQFNEEKKYCAIGGITFSHDSFYVRYSGSEISKEVINQAITEVNPIEYDFEHKVIYSVKALLTLVSLLGCNYSKDRVDELLNAIYKELTCCSSLTQKYPCGVELSTKMRELYQVIAQFDEVINPFAEGVFDLKDPIEYMDTLGISIASFEYKGDSQPQVFLNISDAQNHTSISFNVSSLGCQYSAEIPYKDGILNVGHHCQYQNAYQSYDETVYFYYETEDYKDDDCLGFSLTTGQTFKPAPDEGSPRYILNYVQPTFVTEGQITAMIEYLSMTIEQVKKRIIDYMTK